MGNGQRDGGGSDGKNNSNNGPASPSKSPRPLDQEFEALKINRGFSLATFLGFGTRRDQTDGTNITSTMHFVNVNRETELSLHEQVAAEIRRAIAEGEIGPGERLPPAVDLGKVLGVNKNTVIRSLHVLRDEGLLDFTRGRGIRVSGTVEKAAVLEKVGELVRFARHLGYQRQEIVAMIEGLP